MYTCRADIRYNQIGYIPTAYTRILNGFPKLFLARIAGWSAALTTTNTHPHPLPTKSRTYNK